MEVPGASRYWGRMAFRLPALIALFAAIAGLVSGAIAYYVAYDSYVDQAKERMELVRNERSRAVTELIDEYRIGLASLATRPITSASSTRRRAISIAGTSPDAEEPSSSRPARAAISRSTWRRCAAFVISRQPACCPATAR